MNVWYFLVRAGMQGNLFARLSRVVIEGTREIPVSKRTKRQDKGSRTDFKNLRARFPSWSARLGAAAQ